MIESELLSYLDQLLQPEKFDDFAPNGLQVAGTDKIRHMVAGVTACQAIIDYAAEVGADMLLVHHGFFWKGDAPQVTGMLQSRLKTLLTHDINLIAYHLPLDAHATHGNNQRLAQQLELTVQGQIPTAFGDGICLHGTLPQPLRPDQFDAFIHQRLKRKPLVISPNEQPIQALAWCTGAAQDLITAAAAQGSGRLFIG